MAGLGLPPAAVYARGLSADHCRAVAVRAIGFIGRDRERLFRFLSGAGISMPDFLRKPNSEPHLIAVLDYLITDELALRDFSRAVDIPIEAAYEARRALASTATTLAHMNPSKRNLGLGVDVSPAL